MIDEIYEFVKESNRIESIYREPTSAEIKELERFMTLKEITVNQCKAFISVYQPNAVIRNAIGLDVRVGNYFPPKGSKNIPRQLLIILHELPLWTPFENHIKFEKLHPFTDGNGRLGRAIWAWQTKDLSLGFLHRFYYQTLSEYESLKAQEVK